MENNKTFGNSPAFSKPAFYHPDGAIDLPNNGLTKREYFAAIALQGLLANDSGLITSKARDAVKAADALIEELNKTKQDA
jgi:hypothetical protein